MAQKFATGRNGMAATTSPYATAAAVKVLAEGGNAIDAAAAAHLALMVTDPANASLAGRTQILLYLKDGRLVHIDGATQAPAGVLQARRRPEADRKGYGIVPIPGNLAALDSMLRQYGRFKLPDVIASAIQLASDGFEVPPGLAKTWQTVASSLSQNPGAAKNYLKAGQIPYQQGERFRQPRLAATLRQIAESGPRIFYEGAIGEAMVKDIEAGGGYVRKEDLVRYQAGPGTIVRTTYRGYQIASAGGRAWGDTLVEMLNILEHFSIKQAKPTAAELHILARVMAQALEDRPQELNTLKPKKDGHPLALISSKEFARGKAERIKAGLHSRARDADQQPRGEPHDTTHLSVMDAEGNAVALTTSMGPSFGSRLATAELGFLYAHSYRMRSDPAPDARDETEMSPTFVLKDGRPILSIGAAGSERIPTAILQVISNVIDRGLPLDQAVAAPRIYCSGNRLLMNAGFPRSVVADMRARGYRVELGGQDFKQHLGLVQAVQFDSLSGIFYGAADPGYDGTASGPGDKGGPGGTLQRR